MFVVRLCVRHKPVLYRHDRKNPAGFGTEASTYSTLCYEEIPVAYLQKQVFFPLELYPKLWTLKISPR